jgi:hypothetical protein
MGADEAFDKVAARAMPGGCWRRHKDGKVFEVVFSRNGRVQIRRHGATNLKNTLWLDEDRLPTLYEPADAPPPPTLEERVLAEIGPPEGTHGSVSVTFAFPLDVGPEGWANAAVAFVRRYENATWRWMDVPANYKSKGAGWWSLDVYAKVGGVNLHLNGPGGWTNVEATELSASLKAARDEATPAPEPDHRCPRCTYGWSDDA